MNDDIVHQLRHEPICRDLKVCEEAANEIERLRVRLEQKQREVHEYDRLYQRAETKLRKLQEKHGET